MKSDFLIAVTQLMSERGLPQAKVMRAVEEALISAYKRDSLTDGYDITVRLLPGLGTIEVFVQKLVSDIVEDEKRQISLIDAVKVKPDAILDDVIAIDAPFLQSMGRVAAQTAKQVILQRLREAERELVLEEFESKIGQILPGTINRIESPNVIIGLGKTEAILPREEQVPYENIRIGSNMQFYVVNVATSGRGPEIVLSRSHRDLVTRLFEREVPEIQKGIVEIRAIAREPGFRSKVAVYATQEGVDPVGSCVGLRGFRIQSIVNELQGEKIDVVQWSENTATFLASALSPAQVLHVNTNSDERIAQVVVPDRQLSLAIGKEGQNARLTARLTGWKIEIKSESEYQEQLASAVLEQEVNFAENGMAEIAQIELNDNDIEDVVPETLLVEEISEIIPNKIPVVKLENEDKVNPIVPVNIANELSELGVEDISTNQDQIETLVIPETDLNENEAEEEIIFPDDDSIWVMPNSNIQVESSGLRFAEDLISERGRGDAPPPRGKKKKAKKGNTAPRSA